MIEPEGLRISDLYLFKIITIYIQNSQFKIEFTLPSVHCLLPTILLLLPFYVSPFHFPLSVHCLLSSAPVFHAYFLLFTTYLFLPSPSLLPPSDFRPLSSAFRPLLAAPVCPLNS